MTKYLAIRSVWEECVIGEGDERRDEIIVVDAHDPDEAWHTMLKAHLSEGFSAKRRLHSFIALEKCTLAVSTPRLVRK